MAKRLLHGEESQTFRIQSRTGTYIVRINSAIAGFAKDALAHSRFSRPDLPVPEIIDLGALDDFFYCLSQFLPGRTLQDLSPAELDLTLVPTSRTLAAVAASDLTGMSGFGPFDSNGAGAHRRWCDFVASIANCSEYDWPAVRDLVPADRLNPLIDRILAVAPRCPETRALVHGDFGSTNVLTDGAHITGVLDWSEAMIGDPLYDIANIFFWRKWLVCMDRQASYLESHIDQLRSLGQRLLCYQLRIGLAEVYQNASKRRLDMLAFAMQRCEEVAFQNSPAKF